MSEESTAADVVRMREMSDVGVARSAALNEQELWRDMVRWSGGLIHEEKGLLFVAGPSPYLRVMIRLDGAVDSATAVRRAGEFFAASEGDHIVLVREPDEADLAKAASAAAYTPAWTERPMALYDPPELSPLTGDIDVRVVSTSEQVLAYGRVVAEANDDPGERQRAALLFHHRTILAPHIAALVAYVDGAPVACAMTLVSHGVAGVFYVATVESARRRGLGDALTRMAARAGFALGARAAWLGASDMGADLYRRIGFSDLGTSIVEYESPQSAGQALKP
jgi:ribosomal protein S18 acetylase RimI-like enzyme